MTYLTWKRKKEKLLTKLENAWDVAKKRGAVVRAKRIERRWMSVEGRTFGGIK